MLSAWQENDLIAYLKDQLNTRDKELFVVVKQEVAEKHLWEKEDVDIRPESR